jgi:hypothetical protein
MGEWWEYKIVPTLAIFYATMLYLDAPANDVWHPLVILIVAIAAVAAYVSLSNDWADRADDAAAGKTNRLAKSSPISVILMITPPFAIGVLVSWWWRTNFSLLFAYCAIWIIFSLYSLEPFRLKARGLLGVLADAFGAHVLPALIAVVLVFATVGRSVDKYWVTAVSLWALGYGLRGILWHQLSDAENDRISATPTFVQRASPQLAARIGNFVALPLELSGLAAFLWMLAAPLPLVALLLYAWLVYKRLKRFEMTIVIVAPKARYLLILQEYYDVFLPLSLLVTAAWRTQDAWIMLVLHCLVFPARWTAMLRDVWKMRKLVLG